MSRNGTGTYTLPVGAFVAGTAIVASDMNSNLNDIATSLTQSMSTSGSSPMTGSIKAADGSASAASYAFNNSLGTGFYLNTVGSGLAAIVASVSAVLFTSMSATTTLATYWAGQQQFNGLVTFQNGLTFPNGIQVTTTFSGDLIVTVGMIVGFSSVPIADRINIGDANFFLDNDLASPAINFDSNDTLSYVRASDIYQLKINSVTAESITASTIFYNGMLQLTEIAAPATASANSTRLYAKDVAGTTRVYYKDANNVEYPLGGPGSWEEISSLTLATSAASVIFNLSKVYSRIVVCGVSISATNGGSNSMLIIEVSDDAGASYKAATGFGFGGVSGGLNGAATTVSGPMRPSVLTAAADTGTFSIDFIATDAIATSKKYYGNFASFTDNRVFFGAGMTASMGVVNAIRARWDTAYLFDSGTFTLYGEIPWV